MNDVIGLISLSFLSPFIFCKVKWQHFKGMVKMLYVLAVNLVSFLTVKKKLGNLSTIDNVTICNAMSSFLYHPVRRLLRNAHHRGARSPSYIYVL